jgi:hypothetical protein
MQVSSSSLSPPIERAPQHRAVSQNPRRARIALNSSSSGSSCCCPAGVRRVPGRAAPIDPRLVDWVTKWEKNRIGHMELPENVIEEFPLCESVNSLEWWVGGVTTVFEISAKKYRLEMKSILDEE